ncbi:MAG: aldo/keto reductase [Flavobacteriaceae bacterium]|nr:aldo/keto reductase [Flavobacteriaceae bacterium]
MKSYRFTNGDSMPLLGLGTWRSFEGEAYSSVRTAIELGYRLFDCAYLYRNETEIGQAIQDAIKAGDVQREELFIISKLWNDVHAKEDVMPALNDCLHRLQLEYLDAWLIHWPVAWKKGNMMPKDAQDYYFPDEIPLSETWEAMISTKEKNKAKHIGVSNFNIKHLEEIIAKTYTVPEINQIESHPYLHQQPLKQFADQNNMLMMAYKPLGSGGTLREDMKKINLPPLLEHPIIQEIALEINKTVAQVVLAWQMARGVAVIPKSADKKRQEENLEAADILLNPTQITRLNGFESNIRFVDGVVFTENNSPYTLDYIWGNQSSNTV